MRSAQLTDALGRSGHGGGHVDHSGSDQPLGLKYQRRSLQRRQSICFDFPNHVVLMQSLVVLFVEPLANLTEISVTIALICCICVAVSGSGANGLQFPEFLHGSRKHGSR